MAIAWAALLSPAWSSAAPAQLDCAALRYRLIGTPLQPQAVNSHGTIAGTTKDHRAAVWDEQSGMQELPIPPGFDGSEGIAINDAGHVVGIAHARARDIHAAFYFANGVVTLLPGDQTRVYGISDSDVITGEAVLPGTMKSSAVYWGNNVVHAIPMCCGGVAIHINSGGSIIGNTYDEAGKYHAFVWTPQAGLHLIGDAGRYTSSVANNDLGHVVIEAFPDSFIERDGTLTAIDMKVNYPVHPMAINTADNVVGAMGRSAESEKAFIWSLTMGGRDVNQLIDSSSGFKVRQAVAINARCNIVGIGEFQHVERSGFYLSPINPKTT